MDQIGDEGYANAIARVLDAAEGAGLKVFWGTTGLSLRLPNPDGGAPASVAWVNPPGVQGWLGLSDLVLGYDPASPAYAALKGPLDAYMHTVAALGGDHLTNGGLVAEHLSTERTTAGIDEIVAAIETLGTTTSGA
jgi:hypothetical protein